MAGPEEEGSERAVFGAGQQWKNYHHQPAKAIQCMPVDTICLFIFLSVL